MGWYKDNPKKPYIVKIPNKIRKRITMHERDDEGLGLIESGLMPLLVGTHLKRRGSMWSRFTGGLRNLLRTKPCGGR